MPTVTLLDQYGNPLQNSLENPRFSLNDPNTWTMVAGGAETKAGVRVNAASAIGQPPLWRGISLLSGDVAKLPLVTYERTAENGKRVAREHAAFRLLRRRASPVLRSSSWKRTMVYHALLHGNGVSAIFRDGARQPAELLILNPVATHPAIVRGRLWYCTTIGGEERRLPAEDVFHIRGLSHDGLWGHSVIDVMAEALGLGMAAREFGARFFGDGAQASGVLMVPGHFDKDKIEYAVKAWERMATGLKKAHRVALLQDNVKYQQTSVVPEQAQFLETRQFEVKEVANILGIPPHKLGDSEKVAYNSLESENQAYLDQSLDTWLVEVEEEATDKLLDERERDLDTHLVEFTRAALLRTDLKSRVEAYAKLMEISAFTANDVLRRENMPTIGKDGDKRYRPANWAEVGAPLPDPQKAVAARAALRELLADRVARVAKIETRKATEAAGRPDRFVAWLDRFYAGHAERLTGAVASAILAAETVLGLPDQGGAVKTAAGAWTEESRAELLEVAGRAHSAGELQAAVKELLSGWGARCAALVDCLLPAEPEKGTQGERV